MLIAEDLLLLLTNDDTGKLAKSGTEVDVALGGALLVDLTLMGRVDVGGPSEPVREGRLVVRDAGPTGDAVLDEALATIGEKEGKKPKSVVARLGKGVRATLYGRLVEDGVASCGEGSDPRHLPDRTGGRQRTPTTRRRSGPDSLRPSATAGRRMRGLVRSSRSCSR